MDDSSSGELEVLEPEVGQPPNGTAAADGVDPGRALNPETGLPYTDDELALQMSGGAVQVRGGEADPGRGAAAGGPAMGGGSSGPRVVNNFTLNVLTGWFKGWGSGNRIASPTKTINVGGGARRPGRRRPPARRRNR